MVYLNLLWSLSCYLEAVLSIGGLEVDDVLVLVTVLFVQTQHAISFKLKKTDYNNA